MSNIFNIPSVIKNLLSKDDEKAYFISREATKEAIELSGGLGGGTSSAVVQYTNGETIVPVTPEAPLPVTDLEISNKLGALDDAYSVDHTATNKSFTSFIKGIVYQVTNIYNTLVSVISSAAVNVNQGAISYTTDSIAMQGRIKTGFTEVLASTRVPAPVSSSAITLANNNGVRIAAMFTKYGYSESAASPSIDISGGSNTTFKIAVNGGEAQSVVLTVADKNTGALIATEMQTKIQALGGAAAAVTASYNTTTGKYEIVSGTTGASSSIVITAGDTNDIAADLKIGVANAGSENGNGSFDVYLLCAMGAGLTYVRTENDTVLQKDTISATTHPDGVILHYSAATDYCKAYIERVTMGHSVVLSMQGA